MYLFVEVIFMLDNEEICQKQATVQMLSLINSLLLSCKLTNSIIQLWR